MAVSWLGKRSERIAVDELQKKRVSGGILNKRKEREYGGTIMLKRNENMAVHMM
ncbi:MAG: hypothetical protein HFH29_10020 [Eubacterium sp.]|nr:hypothetical protein [Eubacterium sp.]